MKRKGIIISFITIIIILVIIFLYEFNIIPRKKYTNKDFGIPDYKSPVDQDNDGIDDQTDILINVRNYILTKPNYKSKYYASGYPDDQYGVCTDVVAFGLKDAGYDLRQLVYEHIKNHKDLYDITKIDKNIDFRRVKNLIIYFQKTAINLTTDVTKIEEWQGGDIVVFNGHIGIVSDKRNKKGIPYLIHHDNPYQINYEEDVLEKYEIIGHFRLS